MKLRQSILAIVGALAAALVAQLVLIGVLDGLRPTLNSSTWVAAHFLAVQSVAYVIGFLVTASATGVVLGRLLPGNPITHVIVVGVASPIFGYAVAGPTALAHGWQVAGYAGQLCVIGMIAIRVYNGRHRTHSSLQGAA